MQDQPQSADSEADLPWLTLNKVLSSIVVHMLARSHGPRLLELDQEFLHHLWIHNVHLEAKKALYEKMLNVEQAIRQDNTCWSNVLPTPYGLLRIARKAQTNKRWSIQIPLALLTQALSDVTRAARRDRTARSWKEGVEKSNICTRWKTVPSQMEVLDFIHESVRKLAARWDKKQSERESIEQLLPPLARLQRKAGLPATLTEPDEDAPRTRNGKVQEQGQERRKPKKRAVNPIRHTPRSRPAPPGAEASRYIPPAFNFNATSLHENPWYAEDRREHDYTPRDFTTVLQHPTAPSNLVSGQSYATHHPLAHPAAHQTQQFRPFQPSHSNSSPYSNYYTPPAPQSFATVTNFQFQELFPSNSSPYADQSTAYSDTDPPYDLRGSQPRNAVPGITPLNPSHFLASNSQGYPRNGFTYPPPF